MAAPADGGTHDAFREDSVEHDVAKFHQRHQFLDAGNGYRGQGHLSTLTRICSVACDGAHRGLRANARPGQRPAVVTLTYGDQAL